MKLGDEVEAKPCPPVNSKEDGGRSDPPLTRLPRNDGTGDDRQSPEEGTNILRIELEASLISKWKLAHLYRTPCLVAGLPTAFLTIWVLKLLEYFRHAFKAVVGNLGPAGQIRPTSEFNPAFRPPHIFLIKRPSPFLSLTGKENVITNFSHLVCMFF